MIIQWYRSKNHHNTMVNIQKHGIYMGNLHKAWQFNGTCPKKLILWYVLKNMVLTWEI